MDRIVQKTIRNVKGIAPKTIFKSIKDTLHSNYLYDESDDNVLLISNYIKNPLFQVYTGGVEVQVTTINPILMDQDEEIKFYNIVSEIVS